MIRHTIALILLSGVGFGTAARAQMQAPSLEAQRAAMQEVMGLVGEWSGEGWVQMGPQGRETFRIDEVVTEKLDGLALLVEGHGQSEEPDGSLRTTHRALAVLTWDAAREGYSFQTHTAQGYHTDADLEVLGEGVLRWSYSVPGGRDIRYTIELRDARWIETGSISMDGGETWMEFLQMTLERK